MRTRSTSEVCNQPSPPHRVSVPLHGQGTEPNQLPHLDSPNPKLNNWIMDLRTWIMDAEFHRAVCRALCSSPSSPDPQPAPPFITPQRWGLIRGGVEEDQGRGPAPSRDLHLPQQPRGTTLGFSVFEPESPCPGSAVAQLVEQAEQATLTMVFSPWVLSGR